MDPELDKATLEGLCQSQDSMRYLNEALTYLDVTLPNVTPEEADYLDRENRAAGALYQEDSARKPPNYAASNARYSALANRRLYRVWLARKALAEAMLSVRAVDDFEGAFKAFEQHHAPDAMFPSSNAFRREKADRLYRLQRTLYPLNSAQGQLREFLQAEGYRREPLLTQDQTGRVLSSTLVISMYLGEAMNCQLAHLVLDPH